MSKMKLNFIDLFAGAGGLSEGFVRAGFFPIAHIEMNPTQKNCGTCAYWSGTRDVQFTIIYMDSSQRAKCFKLNFPKSCSEYCGNWKPVGK